MATNQITNQVTNNVQNSGKIVSPGNNNTLQSNDASGQSFLDLFRSLMGSARVDIGAEMLSIIDLSSSMPSEQSSKAAAVQKDTRQRNPDPEVKTQQQKDEENNKAESSDLEASLHETNNSNNENQGSNTAGLLAVHQYRKETTVVQVHKPVEGIAVKREYNSSDTQTPAALQTSQSLMKGNQKVIQQSASPQEPIQEGSTPQNQPLQEPSARTEEISGAQQKIVPNIPVGARRLEESPPHETSAVPGQPSSLSNPVGGIVDSKGPLPIQGGGDHAPTFGQITDLSKRVLGGKQLPSVASPAQTQVGSVRSSTSLGGFEFMESGLSGKRLPLKGDSVQQVRESKLQTTILERIQKLTENVSGKQEGNTMVVHLDPPEIGNLTIKVSRRADQLFARITPESDEVEQAIRIHVPEIVRALTASGIKSENIHVAIGPEQFSQETSQFPSRSGNESFSSTFQGFSEQRQEQQHALPFANTVSSFPSELSVIALEGWVA